MNDVLLDKEIKALQGEYKTIIQRFLDTYEEGGFLTGILLGLIGETIKGSMFIAREHLERGSELTKEVMLDIIIKVNRNFVDLLANDLDQITNKRGAH